MTTPDSDSTPKKTPAMTHGGARPKAPMIARTPLAPSIKPSPHLQTPLLIPRRILLLHHQGQMGRIWTIITKLLKRQRKGYL